MPAAVEPPIETPRTLSEAYAILATGPHRAIAGGTDVMVQITGELGPPPDRMIDLWRLHELRGITADGERLARVGEEELRGVPQRSAGAPQERREGEGEARAAGDAAVGSAGAARGGADAARSAGFGAAAAALRNRHCFKEGGAAVTAAGPVERLAGITDALQRVRPAATTSVQAVFAQEMEDAVAASTARQFARIMQPDTQASGS